MVPKHSLLKYFTLTFTRHKSSKLEGSGPPLKFLLKIKQFSEQLLGRDDPCDSCWYGPLRVQILTSSVFNDVVSPGQSFHLRHFLDQMPPPPNMVDNSSDRLVCWLPMSLSGIPNRWVRFWLTRVRFGSLNRCEMRSKEIN